MRRIFGAGMLAAIVGGLMFGTAPRLGAQAPHNSVQVVFSGTGDGNFASTDTPVGFWIWCEGKSSNGYAGECAGAMYFYALPPRPQGLTVGVRGNISGSDDAYVMTVSSRNGSVACTLWNVPPVSSGPTSTVNVQCSAPSGSGISTNAVVNITGP